MSLVTISSIMVSRILYPELIIKTVTSLSSISTNIIKSVHYLVTISKDDVALQNELMKSDIIQDISIIKSFIEENKFDNTSHTIISCINNLNETLTELEINIHSITEKLHNHEKLWFRYFRSYNIEKEKELIPILIEKLRHRFNLLIKISSIIH